MQKIILRSLTPSLLPYPSLPSFTLNLAVSIESNKFVETLVQVPFVHIQHIAAGGDLVT